MKKLMIAFAVAAMAVASQAAMIKWNMTATKNDAATALDGSSVYMILASSWDGTTAFTSVSDIQKAAVAGQTAEFTVGSRSASAAPTGPYISPSLNVGDTPNYYLLLVDESNNKYLASAIQTANAAVADGVNDKDPGTSAILPAGTATAKAWAAGDLSKGAWTTMSVPEPTSGLLLLLGVAGLALRRRRA